MGLEQSTASDYSPLRRSEAERQAAVAYFNEALEEHPYFDLEDPETRGRLNWVVRTFTEEVGTAKSDDTTDDPAPLTIDEDPEPTNPNVLVPFIVIPEDIEGDLDRVRALVADFLTTEVVDTLLQFAHKRSRAQELIHLTASGSKSSAALRERLAEFVKEFKDVGKLPVAEAKATRNALIKTLITKDAGTIVVGTEKMTLQAISRTLEDSFDVGKREGQIGGKATGNRIGHIVTGGASYNDPDPWAVRVPLTRYLVTNVFDHLLKKCDVAGVYVLKDLRGKELAAEQKKIKNKLFVMDWGDRIYDHMRTLIRLTRRKPLIVRSSSLLEDSSRYPFAGKYDSIFLDNFGTKEECLAKLKAAIIQVYVSVFNEDALTYREQKGLLDEDERMGLLIQRVVGDWYGPNFLPLWAGVGFSRNNRPWSKRFKREDGFARLVFGMGTHAVDRAGDGCRRVGLTDPELHPNMDPLAIGKRSQKLVDVINREKGFTSMRLGDVLRAAGPGGIAGIEPLVRLLNPDGYFYNPAGMLGEKDFPNTVITFDNLLRERLGDHLRLVLARLEEGFGGAVDIEFAFSKRGFHLLQCRRQKIRGHVGEIKIPTDLSREDIFFSANKEISSAVVRDLEYFVHVDHTKYAKLSPQDRNAVARLVGKVNDKLGAENKEFALCGPGRWGSSNSELGVPVSFADISKTKLLIELAYEKDGYVPEVSYGTHFFEDLDDMGIEYLPIYPNSPNMKFTQAFVDSASNQVNDVLGATTKLADVVKVIHIPKEREGKKLQVLMDGENQQAVGFFG
ncbi:PEP/pyruvate-binding domain-containing protein [Oligoflexia bacterium]|nr:PEP/pyruvate-binding domain-containing protein [Oligoflexia bacterium]